MIRLTALYLFCGGLMVLSFRRWFIALCGLLFLSVIIQHPSMPREMAGIQGLNPWNATFGVIFIAWLITRRNDPQKCATPPALLIGFVLFTGMIVLAGLVAMNDAHGIQSEAGRQYTTREVFIETIINPLKYLVVGVMFFDGAVTRTRLKQALFAAVGSGLCYAAMMYKSLKMGVFTMDYSAARRATDKLIGLYANDMAEVLAFTIWAALILVLLIDRYWLRAVWLVAIGAAIPAFMSLKSRAGFLAFCATAAVLGTLKWRRIWLALPIVLMAVILFAPDVVDRVATGVASHAGEENDWDAISAGRTTYLWPAALEQFTHAPLLGHGRYAVLRTGAFDMILDAIGRVPTHPHNSYLEVMLDAGLIGLLICLAAMGGIFHASWKLLRERHDRLLTVIGAIGMTAVVTELAAGVAGSSFYPTQSAIPYLCVWGVALRVAAESTTSRVRSPRRVIAAPPHLAINAVRIQKLDGGV